MLILFDHGTPAPLQSFLTGHAVGRRKRKGGTHSATANCSAAEAAGFEVLITTDKNIRHQQNLTGRQIAIIVLGNPRWPVLRLHVEHVVAAVSAATPGSYTEVNIPR